MELIRNVIFLVKSKGFSWKSYHEDESGLFQSKDGELHVLVDSQDEVPKVTARMHEAIEVIQKKKPESIQALALFLKEDYGNTNRLCHQMSGMGLVDLVPSDDRPKSKMKPVVSYKHMVLTVVTTDAYIAKRQTEKKIA